MTGLLYLKLNEELMYYLINSDIPLRHHADCINILSVSVCKKSSSVEIETVTPYLARKILEKFHVAFKLLATESRNYTDVFLECLGKADNGTIKQLLLKDNVVVGWSVRLGQLHVCSNTKENVQKTYEVFDNSISQFSYPADENLSPLHQQLAAQDQFRELVYSVIGGEKTVAILYNSELCRIQCAFFRGNYENYIRTILSSLFQIHGGSTMFHGVVLSKMQSEVLQRNMDVLKASILHQSQILIYDTVHVLTTSSVPSTVQMVECCRKVWSKMVNQRLVVHHPCISGWMTTSHGLQKLDDISRLHHTVAQIISADTTISVTALIGARKRRISTATGWLFENLPFLFQYQSVINILEVDKTLPDEVRNVC